MNYRVDCFLIWGHGLEYFSQIIDILKKNFEIARVERKKIKNIKKFVKDIYSFDYAPYWHLKDKTKYLLKTKKEVAFIFVKNFYNDEDYFGEGEFRHKESIKIKTIKELIRDKFNPYENGVRTHNHIIHATDNEAQSDYLLKYLGYKEGVNLIKKRNLFNLPNYIDLSEFKIVTIPTKNIYANIIVGENWDNYKLELKKIKETPHYLGLTKDIKIYQEYIHKFLGGPLKEFYDSEKFLSLSKNFKYLQPPYENNYIVVKKENDKYILLDGIHRSCNLINNDKVIVCQVD